VPPPPLGADLSRRPRHAPLIPTILIESQTQREDRKRRSKGWRPFCRKYVPTICLLIGAFFLMQKIDDWFSLEQWVDVYPISIQRDYSTVQGIEELTTDGVDRWCHVSIFRYTGNALFEFVRQRYLISSPFPCHFRSVERNVHVKIH
jgi:hypothetical protein